MFSRLFLSGSVLLTLIALACAGGCGNRAPDASMRGSVSLAWSITARDRQPTTCAQIGAATVSVLLHNRANGDEATASFACTSSPSTTQLVAIGVYDVTLSLRAADGTTRATVPDQLGVAVVAGQVTALAPVTFAMDATGRLVISLATAPLASNCKTPGAGAGLTANTITLERVAGGCAAVTFFRSRGPTAEGRYTVNCTAPVIASCIETDETLAVPAIEPGGYIVHVRGKVGAVDCWALDAVLEVPPAGVLTRTLNLVRRDGPC